MSRTGLPAVLGVGVLLLTAGCFGKCMQCKRGSKHMMAPPPLSGELDGKTFVGEIGKAGATTTDAETITFADGLFHSSACDAHGFGKGMYLAVPTDGTISFKATTRNRSGATNVWTGTVKGSTLEATGLAYEKGKPTPTEYWVKGTLK